MYDQLLFILHTGVNAPELLGIQWVDINKTRRTVKIHRTLQYNSLNRTWTVFPQRPRFISLDDTAIHILSNQPHYNDYVFRIDSDKPSLDVEMVKICDKLRVWGSSTHVLRCIFVDRCLRSGMYPSIVERTMGSSLINFHLEHPKDAEKIAEYLESSLLACNQS